MNDFIPVFVPMIRFRIDKGYLIMFVNVIIQNIFFYYLYFSHAVFRCYSFYSDKKGGFGDIGW